MLNFAYQIVLGIVCVGTLGKMALSRKAFHKYKSNFWQRLGWKFPKIEKNGAYLIWFHAVSVGETRALIPLAKKIHETHPNYTLLISSITQTGHEEAKKNLPFVHYHVYMPWDFRWLLRKILKKASPNQVIICETDLWPNFLSLSKQNGAKIHIVSAKLSERSTRRLKRFPKWSRSIFSNIDLIGVQSEEQQQRFIQAGVDPKKISITGNLKFDQEYKRLSLEEAELWKKQLGIKEAEVVISIGSTHSGEEKILLPLMEKFPNARFLIVPRHPERFQEVAEILKYSNLNFRRYREIDCGENIVLIDSMGLLRNCYQVSNFAIIGGSFVPGIGGHNPLESIAYGAITLFGPYMHSQQELVDLIRLYQAGIQCSESYLENFIKNPSSFLHIRNNGFRFIQDLKGSVRKTVSLLNIAL